ncbi:major capsid protein [Endozoicomonas ascidiicola]|uniref:major capsid protein n=1 Tax=Endozoicomonas ascidiicola TaxID=1698521 RepID=UPI00082CFC34|nr:major capsid protein [Endozoicomonas ascidiicola]
MGFYDARVAHDYVKDAYHRYQDSALLRNDPKSGFRFGDVDWEEYRGQVGDIPFIKSDEAYVIPEGTGIFRTWFAPADYIETVSTIGLPRYAKQKTLDFDKGVQLHTQSNPLPVCLKPRAVIKCKMN